MRLILPLAALACGIALGSAQAQVPGTNLGTPQTQPQPGGGVSSGPGAPTSATRGVAGSDMVAPRGAPPAGGGAPMPGGDTGTGAPSLTPGGAIQPGSPATGGTNSGAGR